ncbi:hypothetical protein KUW19_00705 [Ferrimonas balearica]|uniref:hypothetical protein n=1 Tax=Ferrimonas balearica TaxID=44012 RepID=UPI001C94D64D|nr:hypothetical protein [Ferrimonas balearica]MBY6104996.1 hypothetical protein [Ferrimonas balearica]
MRSLTVLVGFCLLAFVAGSFALGLVVELHQLAAMVFLALGAGHLIFDALSE